MSDPISPSADSGCLTASEACGNVKRQREECSEAHGDDEISDCKQSKLSYSDTAQCSCLTSTNSPKMLELTSRIQPGCQGDCDMGQTCKTTAELKAYILDSTYPDGSTTKYAERNDNGESSYLTQQEHFEAVVLGHEGQGIKLEESYQRNGGAECTSLRHDFVKVAELH